MGILRILEFGFRLIARQPGYYIAFTLNIALAVLLAAGVFSILERVLLKPLPYPEPDRLVSIWREIRNPETGRWQRTLISGPQYRAWVKQEQLFESGAAYYVRRETLIDGAVSREALVAEVTHQFFGTLKVLPSLGRPFLPEEDRAAATPAAVLSHRLWQSAYHGDPGVLGRTIEVNRKPAVVVGVMPWDFRFYVRERPDLGSPAQETELFLSIGERLSHVLPHPNSFHLRRVARLRAVGIPDLSQELKRISEDEAHNEHSRLNYMIRHQALLDEAVGEVRRPLLVIQAAAAVLFLVACVNLTNLIVFRRMQISASIAIRQALGASRLRANASILAEAGMFVPVSVLLGASVAHVVLLEFSEYLPRQFVRLGEAPPIGSLFVAGLVLTLVAAGVSFLAVGFAHEPLSARSVLGSMKRSGSSAYRKLSSLAVIAQVTMATTLLASSLLLLQSFQELRSTEVGFASEDRLALALNLPYEVYSSDRNSFRFAQQLQQRLMSHRGVKRAAFADAMPFLSPGIRSSFRMAGRENQSRQMVDVRVVSNNYFRTLGVDLLRGRSFADFDDASSPPVAIVNQVAAEQLDWGADPLGQEISLNPRRTRSVVGVVANTRLNALSSPAEAIIYVPASQQPRDAIIDSWIIEASPGITGLERLFNAEVRRSDPRVVVARVESFHDLVYSTINEPRFRALLLVAFAALSLTLVGVGLYGVHSQAVRRRRKEIAIRMANGATPHVVFRFVVARGLSTILLGTALGIPCYFGAERLLVSLLPDVISGSLANLWTAAFVVLAVGLLSCVVPADRARRTEPNALLREDSVQ